MWIKEVLSDVDGFPSSKRVITFISLFVLIVLTYCNSVLHLRIEQYMFEAFRDIVFFGIGLVGAEKFTNRPKGADEPSHVRKKKPETDNDVKGN